MQPRIIYDAKPGSPLEIDRDGVSLGNPTGDPAVFFGFIGWSILYNVALLLAMMRMFEVRWRVAD